MHFDRILYIFLFVLLRKLNIEKILYHGYFPRARIDIQ